MLDSTSTKHDNLNQQTLKQMWEEALTYTIFYMGFQSKYMPRRLILWCDYDIFVNFPCFVPNRFPSCCTNCCRSRQKLIFYCILCNPTDLFVVKLTIYIKQIDSMFILYLIKCIHLDWNSNQRLSLFMYIWKATTQSKRHSHKMYTQPPSFKS